MCTNEIQTIEPIFETKIRKGGYLSQPPSPEKGRIVRGVQTKKHVYNHILTKYKRLSPFSNPKSKKGDSMSPAPPGRGRKVRGVQTKIDVYNRVLTKYKRLIQCSNPKSEKGGPGTCTYGNSTDRGIIFCRLPPRPKICDEPSNYPSKMMTKPAHRGSIRHTCLI